MGSAPIAQARLVGKDAAGDLRICVSINTNRPLEFSGIPIGYTPFGQHRRIGLLNRRFYLNCDKAIKVNGILLLGEMNAQGGADGNIRTAIHVFVEHQSDKTGIRHHPAAYIRAILQHEFTFAAIHHQTVGNLILIGSRQEAFGTIECKGQLVALLCFGNVVAVRIFG